MNYYPVNKDALSNGQIDSKLWLCEQLENLFDQIDTIWIYGGWYGLTAFLLRSRNKVRISKIYSLDVDPACEEVADMINENWVFKEWQFKAFTHNCNLPFKKDFPDLIINTSTEHFDSMDWYHRIPKGTCVALQGNNMKHDDHIINCNSLEEFQHIFSLSDVLYKGQIDFEYPTWSFTRFMVIGIK